MRATLTLMGLYQYDNTILDNIRLNLPDGVNIEALTYSILQNCADLEVTIPNPSLFKTLVTAWSFRKKRGWARYQAAITTEYSPLENYDRQENTTVNEIGSSGNTMESTTQNATAESRTRTPNLTDEHQVSAFNQPSAYSPHEKFTHTGTETENGTINASGNMNTESNGEYSRRNVAETRAHGNIGVTTSQQMLESELDVTERLDIYEHITNEFKREFCIMIY